MDRFYLLCVLMKAAWWHNLTHRFPWLTPINGSVAKLVRPLVITSCLVTGATLGIRYLGLMEAAELAAYDRLIQLQRAEGEDDRLLVVGITENDLQTLEEWPISDRTLNQALNQLQQHQPQTIAIDLFRDFPHEPGTEALQTQLQQSSNILTICKVSSKTNMGTPPPPSVELTQVGFADLVVDPGGILRRSLLMAGAPRPEIPFPKQHVCNIPGQTLLSLSFKAALRYLEAQGTEASFTAQDQLTFGEHVIPQIGPNTGGYRRADTNGYQILLHYRSAKQAVPTVSLMEVLNNEVDAAQVRDRIIFIGYTTPQAKDDFYTPYSIVKDDRQKMPGVIVHAQAASQLISTVLDGRPLIWAWSPPKEWLWIFGWSLVGGILGWYLRHPALFAFVILVGCGSLYGICLWVFNYSGWIPLMPPTTTFVGTAVGVVLLDRFNHSGYGQQVYRKVKTFLRLEIEIDEAKLEKQVSEITDTDYFRELKQKVQVLRKDPSPAADATASPNLLSPHSDQSPWDLLADLAGTGGQPRSPVPPPQNNLPSTPTDYGLEFLQDLHHKAEGLKQSFVKDAPPGSDRSPSNSHPPAEPLTAQVVPQEVQKLPHYTPFVFEQTFCDYRDTSIDTQKHVAYLTQQVAVLRASLQLEALQEER